MLNVFMLNVIMINIVMLSVVAPVQLTPDQIQNVLITKKSHFLQIPFSLQFTKMGGGGLFIKNVNKPFTT
jgi:hypothetical protein